MSGGAIAAIVLVALVLLFLLVLLILLPRRAYFSALFSGCHIFAFKLIGMKMRGRNVTGIVNAYILAKKSNLDISLYDLENVAITGGHPDKVVEGIISSNAAGLNFDFKFAKSIDISGRDVLEIVRECLNPIVIELPLITAVAKDNREINTKISLTLKVNVKNFLEGVTTETVSARAVEAVVTKIANTLHAEDLVSRPELLDKAVFDASVDEDSKYELVSADVVHVDFGASRFFEREKEEIEKRRLLQNNQLERRRLEAAAQEQEMKVKAQEAKIRVIEEEAKIPQALKKAIDEGRIKDVVDYYKLQNLQADTEMRKMMVANSKKNQDYDD